MNTKINFILIFTFFIWAMSLVTLHTVSKLHTNKCEAPCTVTGFKAEDDVGLDYKNHTMYVYVRAH